MAGITNYLGNAILTTRFTSVSTYLSLHTSDPGTNGSGATELIGGGYARQLLAWTTASNRTIANTNAMKFLNLTAGTVTYLAIWDALSGGNCLYSVAMPTPMVVTAGQYVTFPVSDIAIVLN